MLILRNIDVLRINLAQAKLSGVPASALEELAEAHILMGNGVLTNVGDEKERNGGRQNAQARSNPERVLRRLDRVISTSSLDIGENPSTDKGANLANGRGNAVVTTTNTSGASLGSQEADVVTGSKLAKSQENAVHDCKSGNVVDNLAINASHDVSNDGLHEHATNKGVLGADPIRHKSTEHSTGEVEHIDDRVPAKDGGQGGILAIDTRKNVGRVDSECICREIIKKPDDGDAEQAEPVEAQDKEVGSLLSHRFLCKLFGFFQSQSQEEQDQGEDDTNA